MKQFVVRCLLVCCAAALAPIASLRAQNHDPRPMSTLHSVQASFIQEKHLPILARPILSRGVFFFQAPRSLRWEYLHPVHSLVLAHGESMKKFIEQDGALIEDQGMSMDAMQVVLEQITNWLAGRFNDSDAFSASFPDKYSIILIPRDKALAAVISRIDLRLSSQEGLVDSVIIREGPEAFTRLSFVQPILNRDIAESLFTRP